MHLQMQTMHSTVVSEHCLSAGRVSWSCCRNTVSVACFDLACAASVQSGGRVGAAAGRAGAAGARRAAQPPALLQLWLAAGAVACARRWRRCGAAGVSPHTANNALRSMKHIASHVMRVVSGTGYLRGSWVPAVLQLCLAAGIIACIRLSTGSRPLCCAASRLSMAQDGRLVLQPLSG